MKSKTKRTICITVILLLIAALPRSIEFLSGNYVFGYDQGLQWLAAKSIIVGHKFPLIGQEVGGFGGFFQGPGWFYLLSVFFALFHGDPYGGIVLMFLTSVATVIMGYFLFRKKLGDRTSLFIAGFLALSPSLISHARLMWPPFVIPPLTVLLLFFIYKALSEKGKGLPWVFFILGCMSHFEMATSIMLTLATGIFLLYFSVRKSIPIRRIFSAAGLYFVPFLPLLIFDLRHNFLNFHGIISAFFRSKGYIGSIADYMPIVTNHWVIFSHDFGRTFQAQFIFPVVVYAVMAIGTYFICKDKKVDKNLKRFTSYLFFLPIVLFILFLFIKNDMWPWWITELLVTNTFLFGIIMEYFFKKGNLYRIGVVVIVMLMGASYIRLTYNFFSKEYGDFGGVHKISGKKEALEVIYKDANGEKFGVLVFTPPVYTLAYDYMFTWYGQEKYGYVPPYEKKQVFYLLIEPDWEKIWRHKGWLETVVKDGTVEKTWNLASGFIIEKRVAQ